MVLDQVTDTEMQAARILGGATMAAFIAAPVFRRQAQMVRIIVASVYFAGVLVFTVYVLI
jgi:hypothetical protein